MKILLADDSMTAQNMAKRILSDAGHEVITVSNGAAALKKISESIFDLLILDIYMPGYTGLEVCDRVKRSPETMSIPVLLSVGKLEPFREDDPARVRADGVIIKPFEATELVAKVEKVLPHPAEASTTTDMLPPEAQWPPSREPQRAHMEDQPQAPSPSENASCSPFAIDELLQGSAQADHEAEATRAAAAAPAVPTLPPQPAWSAADTECQTIELPPPDAPMAGGNTTAPEEYGADAAMVREATGTASFLNELLPEQLAALLHEIPAARHFNLEETAPPAPTDAQNAAPVNTGPLTESPAVVGSDAERGQGPAKFAEPAPSAPERLEGADVSDLFVSNLPETAAASGMASPSGSADSAAEAPAQPKAAPIEEVAAETAMPPAEKTREKTTFWQLLRGKPRSEATQPVLPEESQSEAAAEAEAEANSLAGPPIHEFETAAAPAEAASENETAPETDLIPMDVSVQHEAESEHHGDFIFSLPMALDTPAESTAAPIQPNEAAVQEAALSGEPLVVPEAAQAEESHLPSGSAFADICLPPQERAASNSEATQVEEPATPSGSAFADICLPGAAATPTEAASIMSVVQAVFDRYKSQIVADIAEELAKQKNG